MKRTKFRVRLLNSHPFILQPSTAILGVLMHTDKKQQCHHQPSLHIKWSHTSPGMSGCCSPYSATLAEKFARIASNSSRETNINSSTMPKQSCRNDIYCTIKYLECTHDSADDRNLCGLEKPPLPKVHSDQLKMSQMNKDWLHRHG